MKVNLDKRIVCLLFLYLHLFIAFSNAQDKQSFNYATLNSTIISAEYLDENMIKLMVDNDLGWNYSWRENDWYYFKFEQKIIINSIDLTFFQNTCLDNCKLVFELLTKDTTYEINVKHLTDSYEFNFETDYLILKIKNLLPNGARHINEFKIFSNTVPKKLEQGNPTIKIDKETRLSIKYSMQGLSKSEIKDESKLWKKRKKFFKRYLKNKLEHQDVNFFENRIFYGNDEFWFCYKMNFHLDVLSNRDLALFYDKLKCDVRETTFELRETFFERKMKPTKTMMKNKFIFRNNEISYNSNEAEHLLAKSLEVSDNYASNAMLHICLMGKDKYMDKIYALKDHENDPTKVMAIQGLLYFGNHKKALEVAQKIHINEILSLKKDSISAHGYYAVNSLIIMSEYYPSKTLPMMLELLKEYIKLYPSEKSLFKDFPTEKNYRDHYNKSVQSFRGADDLILRYIESYLSKNPHLLENEILREFKKYIDISKQTDK